MINKKLNDKDHIEYILNNNTLSFQDKSEVQYRSHYVTEIIETEDNSILYKLDNFDKPIPADLYQTQKLSITDVSYKDNKFFGANGKEMKGDDVKYFFVNEDDVVYVIKVNEVKEVNEVEGVDLTQVLEACLDKLILSTHPELYNGTLKNKNLNQITSKLKEVIWWLKD